MWSNKEAIQVPLFAGKLDIFYRFNIFKNKAQLQLGLNAAYNTNYYADAYHPLLHQFYHQHEVSPAQASGDRRRHSDRR